MGQVTVYSGVERRRRWSDEQKRALIEAAFAPGAVVAEVARAADVRPGQLSRWRRDLCGVGLAGTGCESATKRDPMISELNLYSCSGIPNWWGSRSAPIGTPDETNLANEVNLLGQVTAGSHFGAYSHTRTVNDFRGDQVRHDGREKAASDSEVEESLPYVSQSTVSSATVYELPAPGPSVCRRGPNRPSRLHPSTASGSCRCTIRP